MNKEPFDLEEMENLEEIDDYLRSKEWYELEEMEDWLEILDILEEYK